LGVAYQLIVVGGGRMGSALVAGLLRASWCPSEQLLVVESSAEQREALATHIPGVAVRASLEPEDVGPSTGAILCVKPDHADGAARALAAAGVTRVLSVVAGLSSARIEAAFPDRIAVIRSMPNTPVLVGKGASAIAGGSHATSDDLAWAVSILGAVGVVVRVSERQIDAVTGLSGPMPAYLYLVVEALIEAGVHQGLSRDVSRELVIASFEGSAALLAESGESPEELRAQVTSPGGTTAAGLRMLEARAVRSAFLEAVAAATERSRQLGR
jgi:pyrroline-5-carboxylate reductase